MNNNEIQEIEIHDLSHDGRGVGRLPSQSNPQLGKACFIEGALPNERVRWNRTKSKRSFDEGVLVELLESSPERVDPPCQYFQACGGCQLQHLSSPAQLHWKQHQLKTAIERAAIEVGEWLPALATENWHYRRRARLSVRYSKNGRVRIGFKAKGSHNLVEIDRCEVLDRRLNQLFPLLNKLALELKQQGLTQVELTAADQQLAICLYVKKPVNFSVISSVATPENLQVQFWQRFSGEPAQPITKAAPLTARLTDQTSMVFTPGQFVQINGSMNRAMIDQALSLAKVGITDRVLDLFAGAGNFSLAFAQQSSHVLAVEGLASLCRQAEHNANQCGYDHLDVQLMDLEKPDQYAKLPDKNIDLVILDPPRTGAANLIPWLNKLAAPKILYISCHPATMLRDIQQLLSKYRLESVGVMDMFPHTAHIEAMALLVLK